MVRESLTRPGLLFVSFYDVWNFCPTYPLAAGFVAPSENVNICDSWYMRLAQALVSPLVTLDRTYGGERGWMRVRGAEVSGKGRVDGN